MGNLIYILELLLVAGAFWITYQNSPQYAYILLGIVVVSHVVAQFKPIQLYSLLGIVGVLVVMVMSRSVREKAIGQWLSDHQFSYTKFSAASQLFNQADLSGSTTYASYLSRIGETPLLLSLRYHSQQSGNTRAITVHCAYYFKGKLDINELEQRFLKQKENTPKTNLLKSQLGYFDLKSCEIYKPAMGGIAVIWRFPPTIEGYTERYEWIKDALTN